MPPRYIGFLTHRYSPWITSRFGGSIGAGVPRPLSDEVGEAPEHRQDARSEKRRTNPANRPELGLAADQRVEPPGRNDAEQHSGHQDQEDECAQPELHRVPLRIPEATGDPVPQ